MRISSAPVWAILNDRSLRRIVHGYYARNETFSSKKLPKPLKEEIAFPYSISTLGFVLKKLGFRFKRRQRESIIHERSDLIACRRVVFKKNKGNSRKRA